MFELAVVWCSVTRYTYVNVLLPNLLLYVCTCVQCTDLATVVGYYVVSRPFFTPNHPALLNATHHDLVMVSLLVLFAAPYEGMYCALILSIVACTHVVYLGEFIVHCFSFAHCYSAFYSSCIHMYPDPLLTPLFLSYLPSLSPSSAFCFCSSPFLPSSSSILPYISVAHSTSLSLALLFAFIIHTVALLQEWSDVSANGRGNRETCLGRQGADTAGWVREQQSV